MKILIRKEITKMDKKKIKYDAFLSCGWQIKKQERASKLKNRQIYSFDSDSYGSFSLMNEILFHSLIRNKITSFDFCLYVLSYGFPF